MLMEAKEAEEMVYYDLKEISIIIEFSEFPLKNQSFSRVLRKTGGKARRHGRRNNNGEQRNGIKKY